MIKIIIKKGKFSPLERGQLAPPWRGRGVFSLVLLFFLTNLSCSAYETIVNISRLKFKLGNVNSFKISGVDLSNKSGIEELTPTEILKISSSFAGGNLPASFILNIEAKNPNDGTGGFSSTNATLKSFPWRLLIEDKETVSGNINELETIPGTGEIANLPIQVNTDLLKFFKEKGYESILKLALNIGGINRSASNLTLYAQPTVTTSLGDIRYPEEIRIINYEFSK